MAKPAPHFLLVTLPGQGHINPTLQLAKRLINSGAHVTFATTVSGHRKMIKPPSLEGLSYATFSDGYDDGLKPKDHNDHIWSEMKRFSSQNLSHLVLTLANERRPVTCLIYSLLLPWVADVARNLNVDSVHYFIQSATVFTLYYHYFHGYHDLISSNNNDPSFSIELPGLPLLTCNDLPSFFLPSNPFASILSTFDEHYQIFEKDSNPRVLVNTFDSLEEDAIRAIDKLNLIPIGPMIPSGYLDEQDSSDTSYGCDLFNRSIEYNEWLNSKPNSSVIYVSFGSLAVLPEKQMIQIWRGLIESHRPFLWVIRSPEMAGEDEKKDSVLDNLKEELHEGLIVPWCSQVEVLCHPSVGCFVTHCGWNSTVESLVAGVPVLGCPQISDQATNGKLIEDVWRKGVRAKVNEEGVVESEEIKRCLEIVMGEDKGKEMRRNAIKWRDLAKEAARNGGSSDRNLRAFVDSIKESFSKDTV